MANSTPLDPSAILDLGMSFFGCKALLSAVELELFTVLGARAMTADQLRDALHLSPRAVPDFPEALLALGMLRRGGDGAGARYANTEATAAFLDKNSPRYIGGILEMANARLYCFWTDLTEALRSGKPQNEIKRSGEPVFAKLYAEPERLEQFMSAMAGISAGNFHLMSLNMLIEFGDAFDFTGADFRSWCEAVGLRRFEVMKLVGPSSAAIAYK